MLRSAVILFFSFFILLPSYGQYQNLSFSQLTVNEGLSVGNGSCIYKDSKGYIWISTFDGLNRFDGLACTIFKNNEENQNSIQGNLFLNILEDSNTNLWIGSNNGLNVYNRNTNTFNNYKFLQNLPYNQTYSPFYIDGANNIWVQSGQKILVFNTTTKQFTCLYTFTETNNLILKPQTSVPFGTLKQIVIAVKGTAKLYKATVEKDKLNITDWKLFASNTNLQINTLHIDDTQFYIGTTSGLYSYNSSTTTEQAKKNNFATTENILYITTDEAHQLWLGTQKSGLWHCTQNGVQSFTNNTFNATSLLGNQVQYIYKDSTGILWVSLWGQGINYVNLKKNKFQQHLTKQDVSQYKTDNFIRAIIEGKNNELWCATLLNGIVVLNEQRKIIKTITKNLPPTVEHLYKDEQNVVWIATLEGLYTTDIDGNNVTKIKGFEKFPLASQQFNYIYPLQDGRLLTATEAGLFLIKSNSKYYTIIPVKGISSSDVYSTLFQSKKGNIYICKIQKGFGVYQLQNDSLVLLKDFSGVYTAKCYTEADSAIWIGTTKGLLQLDENKLLISKTITTKNGLKSQYIYGAIVHQQNIWMSTNAGIIRYNTLSNAVKNFTKGDGLQSNEFNTYSFCHTSKGEFIFGGVNGLNAFYPNQFKDAITIPPIVLEKLSINDTVSTVHSSPISGTIIHLPYEENTISFQFAVLDYTNPTNCSFQYTLENYDKDWITAVNKAVVRYSNLPSGNYLLKARAINADGIVSTNIYSLVVRVKTPWYRTWWFILLGIGSISFILWFTIRQYYLRKLDKQKAITDKQIAIQQERNRIAADMHDDLGSGLTKITYLSQMALATGDKQNELVKINKTSADLVENMSEIIWAMKEDNNTLSDLILYIKKYAIEYCTDNHLTCSINFPTHYVERSVKGENRRHIYLAIKEILHNIVKHAKATQVHITATYDKDWTVKIRDNGIGLPCATVDKQVTGNGLKNIRKRIISVGGTVVIENDNGTVVTLHIPI